MVLEWRVAFPALQYLDRKREVASTVTIDTSKNASSLIRRVHSVQDATIASVADARGSGESASAVPFSLRRTSPHPAQGAVGERIRETLGADRARLTHALGLGDTCDLGRKEQAYGAVPTPRITSPPFGAVTRRSWSGYGSRLRRRRMHKI